MPKGITAYLLYLLMTILVITLVVGDFSGLQKVQWQLDDMMYTLRGESKPARDIVIVNIDEASLREYGEWPWSFDVLADLVAICNSAKPRSMLVNLDLFSRSSEDASGNTQILANQISWGDNIILTYDIALADYTTQRMSKPPFLFKNAVQTKSDLGILDDEMALRVRKPFLPSDIIVQYADGLGFAYALYDKDRRVRWTPMLADYEGFYYPSAPLLAAALHLGYTPNDIVIEGGEAISVGRYTVPTDDAGRLFINFNSENSFTSYSAADVLSERFNLNNLKDKLVIVGLDARGTSESYATPVATNMSRSQLFANVIENIIHSNYISRIDLSGGLNLLILLAFGVFCTLVLPRMTLLYRMVVLFVCLFILANLTFILFNSYNVLLRPLYFALEIILFMIASPLLDESRLAMTGLLGLEPHAKSRPATRVSIKPARTENVVVRELRDTGAEPEFQATEHLAVQPGAENRQAPPSQQATAAVGETGPTTTVSPSDREPATPVITPEPPLGVSLSSSPLSGSAGDIDRLTHLGRYQVVDIVGKGAMGTVFKGVDPAINRPVALKTIRLDFVSDAAEMEELRDRLSREARAAGMLSHPNIVTIYDIGSENNLHYIAMEYLEGQTLESLIKKKVQFSYKIVAGIISQICAALQYAHDQGIVHRDIKPANIMVLPDYSIKVMDFGIARIDTTSLTRTGIAMGTPNYIAPELLQGRKVDRRCDIFSMGVVMYELLTGRRPFKGENLTALIYSIINDEPPCPSSINENLPPIFDHIVGRALQKNPMERYQKASDIKTALVDFVDSFGAAKKVGR
jgi:CHASE2 domain-containing sensor protein/predicted Ser/Thr protein kinase